jgi:hypothetical protein
MEVDEGWQSVGALLTDLMATDRRAGAVVQLALRRRIRDGEVQIGPSRAGRRLNLPRRAPVHPDHDDSKVLVLASGSLGLITMTGWTERLTLEDIEHHFPFLVSSLIEHEGIGWLLVNTRRQGSMVLGPNGALVVETGLVAGVDPLTQFGEHALAHVRRTDAFRDAPDILVHSAYNAERGETAAFEELVGSHGGLGGWQTQPFLLHPQALDLGDTPIVGAEELHRRLKRWVEATSAPHDEEAYATG